MNAQQLRNSILQQAIQGKLVPQDPADEPASVLLQRIRKEKERLVKEGKLKKKDLESKPIEEDEIPFEIPESWEWVKLKDLFHFLQGIQVDKERQSEIKKEGQVRFLRIIDYTQGTEPPRYIDDPGTRYHVKETDIVMIRYGSPGLPCRGYDGVLANNLFRIIPYVECVLNSDYIFQFFTTPYFQSFCTAYGVALSAIKFSTIDNVVFPLPPLAEQCRIVAKIEELMPLVERYGKAQQALDQLNESLPARLRQSILQEAIQGRLVPQDPKEEPASELLNRIRKEKEQLVKEGKLKKKDLESKPIEEDEIPFEIPESWEWVRLGYMIQMVSGTSYKKNDVRNEGIRVLRGGNIQNNELVIKDDDVFLSDEYKAIDKNIQKDDIIIVASTGSKAVIGKPAFIKETYSNTQIGAFLRIIRPIFKDIVQFIWIVFTSNYYREHIRSLSKGTNINNVKEEYITDMIIPLPPLSEQKRIVAKVEELFGVMKESGK